MDRQKTCCVCQRPFVPHPRVKDRQRTCAAAPCRKELKRRANKVWRAQNPEYFKGRYELLSQTWDTKHAEAEPRYRSEHSTPGRQNTRSTSSNEQGETRHDLLFFARLAVAVARKQLAEYASHFAPKRFTQPSLLACLCLKEYLQLDYRSTEALLTNTQELRAILGLQAVPDHSMLWWFRHHKVTPWLLEQSLQETLQQARLERSGHGRFSTQDGIQDAMDAENERSTLLYGGVNSRYESLRKRRHRKYTVHVRKESRG